MRETSSRSDVQKDRETGSQRGSQRDIEISSQRVINSQRDKEEQTVTEKDGKFIKK